MDQKEWCDRQQYERPEPDADAGLVEDFPAVHTPYPFM